MIIDGFSTNQPALGVASEKVGAAFALGFARFATELQGLAFKLHPARTSKPETPDILVSKIMSSLR